VRHLDRDLKLFALAILLFAFGSGMYLRLLSTYAFTLGASGFAVGALTALMLLVMAAGNAPGAWAADRFRLKPVIVVVWWLSVPAALSFYLAPSWPWLIPGYVISGLYMANNPAMKSYIYLKSEPGRVARNFAILYGVFPLGLTIAPIVGGLIAERYGMRTVFLTSISMYVLSSISVSMIRDTPYHTGDTPWSLPTLWRSPRFRRYLIFFLAGFLAVYVSLDFINPYLAQVHGQNFAALGVYSSLTALGTTVLTLSIGRITDLRGPRMGIGIVLVFMMAGSALLLAGWTPLLWGVAALALGSLDTLRYVAAGVVGNSIRGAPLAWGYAVFDTAMGAPMAAGALLGGILYQYAHAAPFVAVGVIGASLLVLLFVVSKTVDEVAPGAHTAVRSFEPE
jgi:predicted MFS family arabinose efflux permease